MTTVAGIHQGPDTHANRPAATAVTAGALYSCTDHSLIYISDGSSWSTYATLAGASTPSQSLNFAQAGTLATGSGSFQWPAPFDLTIIGVRCAVGTAPTGADLIIDVNKGGTTIYTTQANRPTISAGSSSSTETVPDVTSVTAGDLITVDIDQIGSTVEGADLVVAIEFQGA